MPALQHYTSLLYIMLTQKKPVPCNSIKHKESHHYMNQPERDGQTHQLYEPS